MFGLPSWTLIFPILAFLVLIHELGHFATAKWFGIEVMEFGFGFPPRIFGIRYRGTLYSLNLIPLGGFVRMLGEEDPTHPKSFARQTVGKRAVVLVAGSFMNLLLPVVIFTVLFMLPHDALIGGEVLVSGVAPGSPAQEAGLRGGDTILSVDGERIISPDDLAGAIKDKRGQPVELSVRRGSLVTGLGFSPEFMSIESLTLVPRVDPPNLKVVETVTDPTREAGLREARRYDASLRIGDTMAQKAIGVRIGLANPKFGKTTDPIWTAFPKSFQTIWDVLSFTWDGISQGVSTQSNPGLAGPVGIAQVTGEVVDRFGVSLVFQLTALLSISLGIVNILPIPALDGGRLMFVIIEWLRRGRRISLQREGLAHLVGFGILIVFIVVLSYSDIVRIINGESFLR